MAIMTVHKVTQLPDPLAANAFYILQIAINGEPDHLQFVVTDSNGVPYSTTDNTDLAEMIADVIGAQFLVDSVTVNNTGTNPVPIEGVVTDDELKALIGEVQASPTANTVLDRLKLIATLLTGRLPSALGATTAANSLPVTLSTDGAFAINFGAKADNAASDDSGNYSHISLLKRVNARLTSLIGLLPGAFTSGGGVKVGLVDAIPAGTASIGAVTSNSVVSSASFARPGDILSYTGGDTISNSTSSPTVLTFSNMARQNGGTGTLVRARLMTDLKTFAARCRLHIFHTAPTAVADNVEYGLLWTDVSKRVGYIDFPAFGTEGATNSTAASAMRPSGDGVYSSPDLWYKTAANDTNLYGILTTLDGVAVANAQNFFIELGADRLS